MQRLLVWRFGFFLIDGVDLSSIIVLKALLHAWVKAEIVLEIMVVNWSMLFGSGNSLTSLGRDEDNISMYLGMPSLSQITLYLLGKTLGALGLVEGGMDMCEEEKEETIRS